MPARRSKRKKNQQVEGKDGWTYVTSGPRLPSQEINRPGSVKNKLDCGASQNLQVMSISEIRRRYEACQKRWAEEPLLKVFEKVMLDQLNLQDIILDNIIVLGLGPVSADKMANDSMDQLVVFEHWLSFLRTKYQNLPVYFQDPSFKQEDEVFLQECGYTIIEHPEAYWKLTKRSFLFAPYLPWSLTYTFFYVAYPALFIGNSVLCDMTHIQLERRELLLQSVVQDFYVSRHSAYLGNTNQAHRESGGKHLDWLQDTVLYWSNKHSRVDNSAGEESSSKLRQYFIELMQERTSSEAEIEQPPCLDGLGEWRPGQGFVFSDMMKFIIDKERVGSDAGKTSKADDGPEPSGQKLEDRAQ